MEELLNLVQVIFTSLDRSRSNSMTIIGQCRLNPIIICIQDSSLLYDYIVKIIFKLHEGREEIYLFFLWLNNILGLSSEALQGHRQRLIDQFRRLKRFYGQSSTLEYFKNLIKVPILSEVEIFYFVNFFFFNHFISIESTKF
jgi:huntingtin interacting protein 1